MYFKLKEIIKGEERVEPKLVTSAEHFQEYEPYSTKIYIDDGALGISSRTTFSKAEILLQHTTTFLGLTILSFL